MTSTHFSVQTPICLNAVGSGGSSINLQSPTPIVRVTTAGAGTGLAPTAAKNLSVVVLFSASEAATAAAS